MKKWELIKKSKYFILAIIVFEVLSFVFAGSLLISHTHKLTYIKNKDFKSVKFDCCSTAFIKRGKKTIALFKTLKAETHKQKLQGLMFVEKMPENYGMVFAHEKERKIYMWMKNTYIPLDMIFTDSAGKIVHIEKNTKPFSLKTIECSTPAQYVLEINAGQVEKHNIKINDYLVQ